MDFIRMDLIAEVYQRRNEPSVWGVEAIDMDGDGEIYLAVFSGPDAQQRATEYAREKFARIEPVSGLP
jgi:hypothetical protein